MADGDFYEIPVVPGMGRHVAHDPRNRRFAAPRHATPTKDIRWRRYGPRLNQGSLGACTCYAAVNALNSLPIRRAFSGKPTFDGDDARDFYRGATRRDDFPGVWEPDDTGSSGLAACQELRARGLVRSYEWAFGFAHGLDTISISPLMQGTWWTEGMMNPDRDGRIRPTGDDVGGHEYVWSGVEIRSKLTPSKNRSWFTQSWGDWGLRGTFYMTWDDHEALLVRDGDLIRPVA